MQGAIDSLVELNVGGRLFCTNRSTLTKVKGSTLAAMFGDSSNGVVRTDKEGRYFLDRSPECFQVIMQYLRTGKWNIPKDMEDAMETEISFYGLELSFVATVRFDTTLLCPKEQELVLNWIREIDPRVDKRCWSLLYRASKDGFAASSFHSHCDGYGPSLTLIRAEGFTFGGFLAGSRNKTFSAVTATLEGSFVFSVTNPSGEAVKMDIRKDSKLSSAIFDPSAGPVFGLGDIFIVDNANQNSQSMAPLSQAFVLPLNQRMYGHQSNTFLTGRPQFRVTEIEVFQLHQK